MTSEQTVVLLAEHYRDTYDLTYRLWQQRNRLFLILLAFISVGSLVGATSGGTRTVLADWLVSVLNIEDDRADAFRNSFPFDLVHAAVSATVFYLMLNLNHRAASVLRSYSYLGRLEAELRTQLELGPNTVAFTRESTFYWSGRALGQRAAKWAYVVVLGLLLVAFFGGQIPAAEHVLVRLFDGVVAVVTVVFFADYALTAITLDKQPAG